MTVRMGAAISCVLAVAAIGAIVPSTAGAQVEPLSGSEIVSVDSDAQGKCLDVYDWGRGPWIQMYPCHNGSNQDWKTRILYSDGTTTIATFSSYASGLCIDTYRGAGQQLFQWGCETWNDDQWFRLHNLGDGNWAFESVSHPGQCVDIYDWGRGSVVQLYPCHWGPNQQWIMYTSPG